MKVYVLINNGYSNLEYYDISSDVIGVFSSKEKAIEHMEVFNKSLKIFYNEEHDAYELVDIETGKIDECNSWYTIEEHELD